MGFTFASGAAIATFTQQMLCGLGYSTVRSFIFTFLNLTYIFFGVSLQKRIFLQVFSGAVCAVMLSSGFVGAVIIGTYVSKTGRFILVTKAAYIISTLAFIVVFEVEVVTLYGNTN